MSSASSEPLYLSCRVGEGISPRAWTIRIEGSEAAPLGAYYERVRQSASRVQYISSRVAADRIGIDVRDGNAGEQFVIDRLTGAFVFERMTGLDHSGTERVVETGSGVCSSPTRAP